MPHIRLATRHDLDGLLALENLCFTSDKMTRRNYQALLSKSTAEVVVAEDDNKKIIGCIIVLFRKNSTQARMYSLAVAPDYRRFGVAQQLCEALEKQALLRNCSTIVLEVRKDNQPAIHFYEKNGYEIFAIYTKFYEDGTDGLRMKKNLHVSRKYSS